MSFRTASRTLAFAPVRIGLAVLGAVAALLAVGAAVRPDMVVQQHRQRAPPARRESRPGSGRRDSATHHHQSHQLVD